MIMIHEMSDKSGAWHALNVVLSLTFKRSHVDKERISTLLLSICGILPILSFMAGITS